MGAVITSDSSTSHGQATSRQSTCQVIKSKEGDSDCQCWCRDCHLGASRDSTGLNSRSSEQYHTDSRNERMLLRLVEEHCDEISEDEKKQFFMLLTEYADVFAVS